MTPAHEDTPLEQALRDRSQELTQITAALDTFRIAYRQQVGTLLNSNEDIGLATVYRVLTQFEAAGLVTRHHFENGMAVFELNHGAHHDHIVCTKCGKVEEFMDEIIEQRQQLVAREKGFTVSDHSLYIYGLCKDCQV